MHPTQHTTASPRPHPAPGRILSVMVDNLQKCRSRGLSVAPRRAAMIEDSTPQQERIRNLHLRASTTNHNTAA